jgi:predicted dehydrogenase
MTLKMGIIGCGGMGLRHVQGISEVTKYSDIMSLEAVCDRHVSSARHVANAYEQNTGSKPKVYVDLQEMLDSSDIDILDVVTDTRTHHSFAIDAMNRGINVMTEKPMGITLRACKKMEEIQKKNNVKLAVAENYRRDPMNRLVKALIDRDVIGSPQMVIDLSISGGGLLMHGTGWRAKKSMAGSLILEQGVHTADLILYFMGDAESIYARTSVMQPKRRVSGMPHENIKKFYSHRIEDQLSENKDVIIDTEDTAFSVIQFKSGAIGQMTMTSASNGYGFENESIHGTKGTIKILGSRNGRSPVLHFDSSISKDKSLIVSGDGLLDLIPEWGLDDITSLYFDGAKRISSYDYNFEEIDRKLIAIEMHDLAYSILNDATPEVESIVGMKALALAYGALESGEINQIVSLEDVLSGKVDKYQSSINHELNI